QLATSPDHDPFVISPGYFPKPTPPSTVTQDGGKSNGEQAEDASQIEVRRIAHLQALAGQLRLEAAMGGTMAVIDGKTYHRGDWIPGTGNEHVLFMLAEVRQRSIILECEEHRFEL